jgi:hypothetical protein
MLSDEGQRGQGGQEKCAQQYPEKTFLFHGKIMSVPETIRKKFKNGIIRASPANWLTSTHDVLGFFNPLVAK